MYQILESRKDLLPKPVQELSPDGQLLLFSGREVLADSLQYRELQHARFPCPSLSPKVCSCLMSQWCLPTIISSFTFSPFPYVTVFSNDSGLRIRWPNYWSISFSISPSSKYAALISFQINLSDLLAVQGTLQSFLQCHTSKASILWHSAFFIIQLSHLYIVTGTTIALIMWIFVSKLVSLPFNTLSTLVIAFLPRGRCLSNSCLQSLSAVISEPRKIKSATVSSFSPSVCQSDGTGYHDLFFWTLSLSQLFHSPLSPSSRSSLVPVDFLPLGWCHLHIWGCCCFSQQSWL